MDRFDARNFFLVPPLPPIISGPSTSVVITVLLLCFNIMSVDYHVYNWCYENYVKLSAVP